MSFQCCLVKDFESKNVYREMQMWIKPEIFSRREKMSVELIQDDLNVSSRVGREIVILTFLLPTFCA